MILFVIVISASLGSISLVEGQSEFVPDWVKNNAGWWAEDQITNTEFLNGVEFLIDKEVIQVPGYVKDAEAQNPEGEDHATVGGGVKNSASGVASTISGGSNNVASETGSTVSGGVLNKAISFSSTIGGGMQNSASGSASTISGGEQNKVGEDHTTVGGGVKNSASGVASTISGGSNNVASETGSTVSGGEQNTVGGMWATVPGGLLNQAKGDYSFAAGVGAIASHAGSTVFSDYQGVDFESTADNQFSIRAANGVKIVGDLDVSGTITSSDKSSDTEREITYIPKRGKHTVGPLEIPTVFNSLQPILHIKLENQYKDRGLITVDGFNTRSHGSVCAMERICVDGMCGNVVDTYGGLLPIGSPLACTFNNMFYNSGLGSVTGNEIVWASAESGAFSGQFNIYYIYNEEVYADTLKPTPNNEGIVEVTTSTEYYTSAPNLGQVR